MKETNIYKSRFTKNVKSILDYKRNVRINFNFIFDYVK